MDFKAWLLDVSSSLSSSASSSSASGASSGEPANVSEWFAALWTSIVEFFTTGKISENSVLVSLIARIIIAILFFFVFFYLNKFIIYLLRKGVRKSKKMDQSAKTAKSFVISVIKAILTLILITIICAILGFDMSGISTIISSAIVAIGLSLQNVIANFASGIIILSSKMFLVGDYVDINNGSAAGTVKDIDILETKLITPDNVVVYVPNSTITSGVIQNFNVMTYRRINLSVSVSYDSDIEAVKKILRHCVDSNPDIVKDMPITIAISDFANSSINFCVRCYVLTPAYWDVRFALSEQIYKDLVKRKVNIPYSQMDVHIHSSDEKAEAIDEEGLEEIKAQDGKTLRPTNIERTDDEAKEIEKIISKAKKTKSELESVKEKIEPKEAKKKRK